eukprot:m51a1_g4618 hypothetical protein (422) ;mRNA; f:286628-287956
MAAAEARFGPVETAFLGQTVGPPVLWLQLRHNGLCTHNSFLDAFARLCALHPLLRCKRLWSDRQKRCVAVGPDPIPSELPVEFHEGSSRDISWLSFTRRAGTSWTPADEFPWEIEVHESAEAPGVVWLVMQISHAISDGMSLIMMFSELSALLSGLDVERTEFNIPKPLEERRPQLCVSDLTEEQWASAMNVMGAARKATEKRIEPIIVSETMDACVTSSLAAACKREHVTVTDAIAAALLIASPAENVEMIQAISLRKPGEPVAFCLDISAAFLPLVDPSGCSLWDTARKVHRALKHCLESGDSNHLSTPGIVKAYCAESEGARVPLSKEPMHTILLSSMGDIERRLNARTGSSEGACKWEDFAALAGNPYIAGCTFVWASTMGGVLRLTATDMAPPRAPEEIRSLVGRAFHLLGAVAAP